MADTKQRLVDGAVKVLGSEGLAGASARAIATAAGVNQALVFYHFGTVDQLLSVACRQATERRVALYRARFTAVTSIAELLDVGRQLQQTERAEGNIAILAQLLAGAQTDERLAPAVAAGLDLWITEIESVLGRLTATSPVADLVDVPGLAQDRRVHVHRPGAVWRRRPRRRRHRRSPLWSASPSWSRSSTASARSPAVRCGPRCAAPTRRPPDDDVAGPRRRRRGLALRGTVVQDPRRRRRPAGDRRRRAAAAAGARRRAP